MHERTVNVTTSITVKSEHPITDGQMEDFVNEMAYSFTPDDPDLTISNTEIVDSYNPDEEDK